MSERSRKATATVLALLVIAGGPAFGLAAPTPTAADVTVLTACTTITEPGHYVLGQDIENSDADVCIGIQSSDVHFDGGGHTIDGTRTRQDTITILEGVRPNTSIGVGISLTDAGAVANVTVTDVRTTDWLVGVLGAGVSNTTIHGVRSRANGAGIWLDGANDTIVTASNSSDNTVVGVVLGAAPGRLAANNAVVNVTANRNGQYGVILVGSSDSVARHVTATRNGYIGFVVGGPPSYRVKGTVHTVVVADSDFSRNGYHGLQVLDVTNVTLADTAVAGTQGTYPSDLFPETEAPRIPSAGILVIHASQNTFTGIDARKQAAWTYLAAVGSRNTVENLTTDAGVVSFEARDIALGPTATAPVNVSHPDARTLGDGLTIFNMSNLAFITMHDQQPVPESEANAANETTTESVMTP